ncbi:seminal plasma glycoprotein PSP-I [Plecturocebus cupreus]
MRLAGAFAWALLCSTATTVTAPYATAPSDCGGHYTDDYGRIINYVGPKTECVWVIEYNPGEISMVAVPTLEFTCGKEYVEVLDGPPGSASLARICHSFSNPIALLPTLSPSNTPENPVTHTPSLKYITLLTFGHLNR